MDRLKFEARYALARAKRVLHEKIPMAIAWKLPKRVAFWAFIRVHALSGEAPGDCYKQAYDLAERKWKLRPPAIPAAGKGE